jgi:hypothetical protein
MSQPAEAMQSRPRRNVLVLINLAAASANCGLALLAQVNWSLWQYVGRDAFATYHVAWWHSVWWSIFPLAGVAFAGVIAQAIWRPVVPGWMVWLALFLQIAAYAGTALWWAPGQARLTEALLPDGRADPAYLLYLRTNWIRVAIFAAAALLQLWVALRHFGSDGRDEAVRHA